MVVRQGAIVLALGPLVSLASTLGLACFLDAMMANQLYRVSPTSPLALPEQRACWRWWDCWPATSPRAAKVDPMMALNYD
jgi:hypothetical protein